MMTSRELVHATLEFRNKNSRAPRQIWPSMWAIEHCEEMFQKIQRDFPDDIVNAPAGLRNPIPTQGSSFRVGTYVDEWGCTFVNIYDGIQGEVKDALVKDEDWDDWENVQMPMGFLDLDVEQINAFCKNTDQFVNSGFCPRPFERLQYIRTTEELFVDLVDPPKNMLKFMDKLFVFYCEVMEKWAKTDIDALSISDDWGSQKGMLINPRTWDKYFKPFYKEFADIAHRNGKKLMMHSCGNILDLYPRLIEIGVDGINSQIFLMGLDNLEKYKGQITFWGDIDRQYILPRGSVQDVENAVKEVNERLWDNGGCIAQFAFDAGHNPENAYAVFKAWEKYRG